MQRIRLIGSIAVVTVCLVAAGCGGSDDSSSSAADPAAATEDGDAATDSDAASSDAESASSDSESAEVVSGEVPELSDGGWEGTIHFEISGEIDASADIPGGAFTQGGITIMSFAGDATSSTGSIVDSSQISLSNDPETESAVFVTAEDVAAGGVIGKECSVSMSTNDESTAAGDFQCEGVPGVSTTRAEEYTVNIEGSFTLQKG